MMPAQLAPHLPGSSPAPVGAGRGALARRLSGLPWRPVLLSLLAARVVVLLALGLAQALHAHDHHLRTEGLLGWDASWYDRIATYGYGALPDEALRFFPLLPLLVRGLAPLLLGSEGAALLVLGNVGAVAFGLVLHRLVEREGLGPDVARRAVWVAALVPAGFVQVMGYTEPLYGALVCGLLLAARERRWEVVALLGLLAGALRPPGVVLAAVVLVEALRGVRRAGPVELLRRAVAVAAPAAGLAAYLLWVRHTRGDALLPFRVQVDPLLRGGTFVDPAPGVAQALRGAVHLQLAGSGLHVLWAVLATTLLVAGARRLPLSWTVLSGLTLLLGVTARSMTSFERYAGGAVPLLVATALVLGTRPRLRRGAAVLAPAVLAAYSTMAFLHLYVP